MKIYKDGNLWFEATSPNELLSMCQTIANSLRNNYFTNVEIMNLIASARSVYQVETMPSEPTINTVYYVGTQAPYDVKLVDSNGTVVNLGDSDADFSNFYTKAECDNRYLYKQDFLNTMYPKGSIYTTYENKNPSTFLGGTWVLIGGQDANLNYYPAFAISTDTEGTTINESLPNITGGFGNVVTQGFRGKTGAFETGGNDNGIFGSTQAPSNYGSQVNFDASRVSTIYQNNAHVNVNAIKLFFWRRIDDAPIVFNTGNITMDTTLLPTATNDHIPTSKAVVDYIYREIDRTNDMSLSVVYTNVSSVTYKKATEIYEGSRHFMEIVIDLKWTGGQVAEFQNVQILTVSGIPLPQDLCHDFAFLYKSSQNLNGNIAGSTDNFLSTTGAMHLYGAHNWTLNGWILRCKFKYEI